MEICLGKQYVNASMQDHTDVEPSLIERCKKQDYEAFGKFVDVYEARIFGYVKRLIGRTEEAQDITQDVFIRAYQAFPRFDERASAKTWVFRIAHNLCIDSLRKSGRRVDEVSFGTNEDSEEWEVPDDRWQPDSIAMNQELQSVVESALGSMSEKLRSVLLLHDKEDASYEQISEVLNVPVGTVKSRLFLARAHLQKALGQYL